METLKRHKNHRQNRQTPISSIISTSKRIKEALKSQISLPILHLYRGVMTLQIMQPKKNQREENWID